MSESSNYLARFNGLKADDRAYGTAAADINGDGEQDLVVAATGTDVSGNTDSGRVYVVFGPLTSSSPDLSGVPDTTGIGANGFRINGAASDDAIGTTIATGDINGDDHDDILIGAPKAEPAGHGGLSADDNRGVVFVVYGKEDGAAINLNKLDPHSSTYDSSLGFQIEGPEAGAKLGSYVASSDDLNGDDKNDILIATNHQPTESPDPDNPDETITTPVASQVYVVFSSAGATDLSSTSSGYGYSAKLPTPTETFTAEFPQVIRDAGDVNGDGTSDQIIGSIKESTGGFTSGSTWILYGSSSSTGSAVDLSSDTSSAARFDGEVAMDYSGASVDGAGDVNQDGYDDFMIGAPWHDSSSGIDDGTIYMIYGGPDLAESTTLSSSISSSDGYIIKGDSTGALNGFAVRNTGDINGDSIPDQLIGGSLKRLVDSSGYPTDPETPAGGVCVVLGQSSTPSSAINLNHLSGDGWCYYGPESYSLLGSYDINSMLDTVGDLDGDGFPEFAFGYAAGYSGTSGAGGVLITSPDAIPAPFAVTGEATNVTDTSATLNGTVDPNGNSGTTKYQFEYSTKSDLSSGISTFAQDIGTTEETASLSLELSDLKAKTTYYYRIAATNDLGYESNGEIKSFTTSETPSVDANGDGEITEGDDYDGDGKYTDEDADIADINNDGEPDIDPDLDGDGDSDKDDAAAADVNGNGVIDSGDDINGDGKITNEDIAAFLEKNQTKTNTITETDTPVTTTSTSSCTKLVQGNGSAVLSKASKLKKAQAQLKLANGHLIKTGSTTISVIAPKGAKLPKLKSVTFYIDKTKLAVDKRKGYKTKLSATTLSANAHTIKAVLTPKKGKKKTIKAKLTVGDCPAGSFKGTVAKAKPGKNTAITLSYKAATGSTQSLSSASLKLPKKAIVQLNDLRKLKGKKIGTLTLSDKTKVTLKLPKKGTKKKSATLTTNKDKVKITIKAGSRPQISVSNIPTGNTGFSLKLGKKSQKLLKVKKAICKPFTFDAKLTGSAGETVSSSYQLLTSCKK